MHSISTQCRLLLNNYFLASANHRQKFGLKCWRESCIDDDLLEDSWCTLNNNVSVTPGLTAGILCCNYASQLYIGAVLKNSNNSNDSSSSINVVIAAAVIAVVITVVITVVLE